MPFPRFADNNDEAFDAIIISNNKWIVIECKAGFLKAEAKYAENETEFARDLALKFGSERGAGVEQLARKVGDVFAKKETRRRRLKDLDSACVVTVVPVLIVQDLFVSSVFATQYLCSMFRSLRGQHPLSNKVCCTGLVVLDIDDVETMRPYVASDRISLSRCLFEKAQLGDYSWVPFNEFFTAYLSKMNVPPTADQESDERFQQILDRSCQRFFGHPFRSVGTNRQG